MTPRILVVDDERQIYAALRLRLGGLADLTYCASGKAAVETVARERFDLCFVDLQMPGMDGFEVIEESRKIDSSLGYVVISGVDTPGNLRRTIPLQVFDFLTKPLPEKWALEDRLPDWVRRTREARHSSGLAQHASMLESDLDTARLEREIELLASDGARDALLNTATLLTAVHAHLVTATALLASRTRSDPALVQLARNVEEAKRSADAARAVAEQFFGSLYANRDTAPAVVNECVHDAVKLAVRYADAAGTNVVVDVEPLSHSVTLAGVGGMQCLAMLAPLITTAVRLSPNNSTVRVRCETFPRLDGAPRHPLMRTFLWLNRRLAATSSPAVVFDIAINRPAMSRPEIEAWLRGERGEIPGVPAQALLAGLKTHRGLWGFSVAPTSKFRLVLALPA